MSVNAGFVEHLKDVLGGIGQITVRRMFGGAGLYCDGYIFAFLNEDVLYLKTDEAGRAAFEAEGMGPFTFESTGGTIQALSYYRAPERLLDDSDDMREWVLRAVAVSKQQAAAKAKKKPRASPNSKKVKAKK